MASKTGFGEDPAQRGFDITQGYRDRNDYFDKDFVKRNIEPYKDAGLSQSLGDYRGKSDRQLYDMAAAAVIKLAKPGKAPPVTTPPPATPPPVTPPPGNGGNGNGNGGNGGNKPPKKKKKRKTAPVPVGGNKTKILLPEERAPVTTKKKKKKKPSGSSSPVIVVPRNVPRDIY